MAEILAVIALVSSIVQLVDFSAKVVKRLDEYATAAGEVPRAFQHIKTELPLITDSLRRIQDQAQSGSVEKVTIDAVEPVIKDCFREIRRLEAILDKTLPPVGASSWERRKKAIISLGRDKRVEEIAESLRRYVRVLTLSQTVGGSKSEAQPRPTKLQSFTLIPFDRNAHFVEREDIFLQIDETFKVREGSQPKAALYGLGGIGKSQIALEYCFRRKEKDPECSIFWVHAATGARFEETYKRIATDTGCGIVIREDTHVDVMQLIQHWLEIRYEGRWLMVVDNIDDVEVFFQEPAGNSKTLSQYIPRTSKGSLLFTTRSRDIAVDLTLPATPIAVPVLTRSEGASLLNSRIPGNQPEEQVFELLKEVEYLPLAITQAAAFMSKRKKPISQYLDLYQRSSSAKVRMLSYEFSDHGRQYSSMESVAKTWIMSFESIRKGNSRAADLLSLMSYFDRHAIPLGLLYDEDEDLLDFEDAVAVLSAFSLIESDEAGASFDVHHLVQLATKWWLANEKGGEEDKWAFQALISVSQKFPQPRHHPEGIYWQLCATLMPHAELILDHAFKSQQKEVELARASLLFSVAGYDHWRGAWMKAMIKTEEAFNIRKTILGEKDLNTLKTHGQLAWTYAWVHRNKQAVEVGSQCLELRREVLGEDHPDTIDCLSDIAVALQSLGEFDRSEAMQRQAYEASKRVLGAEHLDTLNCLGNLGSVLDDLGRHEDAEAALRKVVNLKGKVLGDGHPTSFAYLHDLAVALNNQGKNTEAEQIHRRVLVLSEKIYGKDHSDTLVTLNSLVKLLKEEEKFDDIEELGHWFREGPKIELGDDHPFLQEMQGLGLF